MKLQKTEEKDVKEVKKQGCNVQLGSYGVNYCITV